MSDATHDRIRRYAEAAYEIAVAERQEKLDAARARADKARAST